MVQPEQVVDTYLAQWLETDLSNRASVACEHDSDTSEITHESGIVTALYRSCRTQLSRLSAVLASSSQRCRILLTESRSKLVIFGGSLENGRLESCLNVNDEVKDDILLILYEIGTILAYDIFQHACKDLVAFRDDDTSTTLKGCLASVKAALTAESGSDTSEDESASEDDKRPSDSVNARTLERQCLRPLAKNVDLLMLLYPTLEQIFRDQHQPPRARLPRPIPKISVTGSALPYVHNVRDKFPKADKDLAERLGEANWQRHERLRAARTSGASEQPILAKAELPKSIFQPISEFRDSALGESLASSSARAPSVASHSSYLSSIEGGEKEHFRVPKMPAGADYHIAFSCPYCGERASMRNRIDWKMHVFADLQAYICTHPKCSEGWATFPSRRKWFEHETTYHMTRNRFRCTQLNCTLVLEMEEEYLAHVRGSHAISFETSANKWSLLNAATISTVQPVESLRCPLCHISDWTTYRKYEKHLGKHQEEIALCALPPSAYDNDNDDDHDAGGHEGAYDSASSTSRKEVNDLEGHDGLGPDKRDAQTSNLSRRRSRLPTNNVIFVGSMINHHHLRIKSLNCTLERDGP
ncbi:hypothetical protein EDD37DRAFT_411477 [Exophiala viscosa]|uniref:uncharacterized protein n=1 Tax=Exophiala viscosa TaxID=2486360 RepID=UPI00219F46E0|nr:hypothetical protein EDD37DRAFT_411477 [Exophiala viscosa]